MNHQNLIRLLRGAVYTAAVSVMAACGDGVVPTEPEEPPSASIADAPEGIVFQNPAAPPLETYDTTFTVVQGQATPLKVCYEDPAIPCADDGSPWFMKLLIHQTTDFIDSDGVALADGDTLQIGVRIDSTRFLATFTPHGVQFVGSRLPVLRFALGSAALNADPADLRIWHQAMVGEEWSAETSEIDVQDDSIWMDLSHFSNYAVAF